MRKDPSEGIQERPKKAGIGMEKQRLHINGADGFRAIACLLVLYHHLTQKMNFDSAPNWFKPIHHFGMRGEVGVSLFFVLSGALLSFPYWKSLVGRTAKPRLSDYALARVARIVPATWFNLILCTFIALYLYEIPVNFKMLFTGLFFVNSYHYSTFFPAELNGPLWSIGLEVSCYVLLPVVLFLIFKMAKSFFAAFIPLTLWIVVNQFIINPWVIERFMTGQDGKGWDKGLVGGAKEWLPYWNIVSFFSQFMIGALAALIIAKLQSMCLPKKIYFDISAIALLIAAIALVGIRLTPGAPDALTRQPYISPFYALIMGLALVGVSQSVFLYKAVDNRLFRWISQISFGVYLWHQVVQNILQRSFKENYVYFGVTNLQEWSLLSSIVIAIAFVIATLSWNFFERPILRSARRKMINDAK
jgi:peptidoglycan/LPS O-acetylase OafA/YrhL